LGDSSRRSGAGNTVIRRIYMGEGLVVRCGFSGNLAFLELG